MPKLDSPALERKRRHIEDAALRLFVRQGYRGTSIKDISRQAGVSPGNIYNYYQTKEALYVAVVGACQVRMAESQRAALRLLPRRVDAAGPGELARATKRVVEDNPDYWRLMCIDVVEFGNRHFAQAFRQLSRSIEKAGSSGPRRRNLEPREGLDPADVAASVLLPLFTQRLVEKLFGGKQRRPGNPKPRKIHRRV